MRSGAQVLWRLVLLSVLVGLVGNSGSWDSIESSAQQQSQPPADTSPCNQQSGNNIIVGSADALQDAVDDPDCQVIRVRGGFYIWPTEKHPYHLTIQRKNSLTIKSLDPSLPRLIGRNFGQQTITIIADENTKITLQGLVIARKAKFGKQEEEGQSNIGILVTESKGGIELIDNLICGYTGYIGAGISIDSSSKVKIQGNKIGTSVDKEICPEPENEVGVSIKDSTVEFIGNDVRGNKKDGVQISNSTVTILDSTVRENKGDGIAITSTRAAKVTIERTVISHNKGDGVKVTSSTLEIKQSEIFQNEGCGINIEGRSVVNDPQGPSNWIAANANGNICGPEEIKALIKKREIKVPRHVDKIQDAVKDAEPVKGSEAPYTILVGSPADAAAYVESLCIDRSVKLQAEAPLTLKAKGQDKPAIAIALEDCSLNSDESSKPTVITFERSPTAPLDAGWTIEGGLTGVRVGTVHALKNRKDPVYLQVELKDVTISGQQQAGIEATASGKGNIVKLDVQGSSALVDNQCKSALESTQARRIETGITLASKDEALVKASIKNVQVSSGKGDGIRVVYEGQLPATRGPFEVGADLELSFSVVKSAGQGLTVMSSKGARPELFISHVLVQENAMGGINLQADPGASLSVQLGYLQIIRNENFGAQFRGPMQVVWEEPPITTDERGYKDQCQVINNKGPGVHLEGGASVELSNLKVISNKSSGIMVVGSATTLTLKQSHLSYNQYHGVALQAQESGPGPRLRATIKNNRIENNRKWGVTQIVRGCVQGVTRPEFYGDVTKDSKENLIFGNGLDLTESEKRAAPNGQVCPEALIYLMEGSQQ